MIRTLRAFDPHSIKLVIFDLDGTLIDSRLDLVHSVNAALRHIGRPELPEDVIASYVGDGAPILIQRALGGEAVDEAVVRKWPGIFSFLLSRAQTRSHDRLPGNVRRRWPRFSKCRRTAHRESWPCCTNKPVHSSRAIVEALGLGQFFSQIYGGNSFATKKPDPEGARKLAGGIWRGVATRRDRRRLPRRRRTPDATPAWSPSA